MNRRKFLSALPVLSGAVMLPRAVESKKDEDLTSYVDPRIGTGGHGHTYLGATVPFGMVQLGPDTYNQGWDWCSGYHDSDRSIMGFSHTHLSGTGIGDMMDVLIMPGVGEVKLNPGSRENPQAGYRSRFKKENEHVIPGSYHVLLDDPLVDVQLTATARAGMQQYTFRRKGPSHFVIDLRHGYGKASAVQSTTLQVRGDNTLVGTRIVNGWAKGRQIHFAMKFLKPFDSVDLYVDGTRQGRSILTAQGRSVQCVVHFRTTGSEDVFVKTGISGVSIEGAETNLDEEIPHWDFEYIRTKAKEAWQRELSKIKVTSANEEHKKTFYTALYHSMLAPTLFDDVDGRYRGMDGKVHRLPNGVHNYSTFSLWDTYRACHPLFTIFQGERVPDFVNCLARMTAETPSGPPVWPLQGKETFCMTGYHSVVVIAEAIAKKFPGLDLAAAYPKMKQRAFQDDYQGLALYRKFGYIPCDLADESVSKTLGYVYDDWAVSNIAQALGYEDDHKLLRDRAQNYRKLFDKKTGFIRPRLQNGDWAEPLDPKAISITKKWKDFTESNAWQETFSTQHDPHGLIELFGDRDAFLKQLDVLFAQSTDLPPGSPPDIAGLVGMYAHGNEPSHHIAYLYAYAGAPYRTQELVHRLVTTMYKNAPDGIMGNEDCGQMSAWYVMSAIGFYAVDPVSANYVFGSPLFDRVEIDINPGKKLVVEAKKNSPIDIYIQSIKLNGKPYDKAWFRHADIAQGGQITFGMGSKPNFQFGKEPRLEPPSQASAVIRR